MGDRIAVIVGGATTYGECRRVQRRTQRSRVLGRPDAEEVDVDGKHEQQETTSSRSAGTGDRIGIGSRKHRPMCVARGRTVGAREGRARAVGFRITAPAAAVRVLTL